MLTETDPTEVTITASRGPGAAELFGYKLRVTGFSILASTTNGGTAEEDPPPQALRIVTAAAAATGRMERNIMFLAGFLTGVVRGADLIAWDLPGKDLFSASHWAARAGRMAREARRGNR